jgi:hypothetical protein
MKHLMTRTAILALAAMLLVGCGKTHTEKSSEPTTDLPDMPPDTVDTGSSGHPTHGPHNGGLIELGKEEYHAELIRDKDAGSVTIYLLDGATAKVAVATDSPELTLNVTHDGKPEQFKFLAQPDKGDPEGKSSRFVSNDAELMEHLGEKNLDARLVVKIDGKSFNGKIVDVH